MFFILSKVLSFLAQPLFVVVALAVAGITVRSPRWKKLLLRTSFGLLLFFSNYFIANEVMRAWEVPVTTFASLDKKYDYGILLTGVTKTEMTPKDRVYFNKGADRAVHTLQLYKLGYIKKILISGGSGRLNGGGVREADDLAEFMKLAGVPDEDLILENVSKNTHESALEVSKLLANMSGSKELILITSAYHMRRSLACFEKAGVITDQFSAEPTAEIRRWNPEALIIPRLDAITIWQVILREWVGFVAYYFAGYV